MHCLKDMFKIFIELSHKLSAHKITRKENRMSCLDILYGFL